MLFRRRNEAAVWERVRVWLWPRVSWRRSGRYFAKRTLRLTGTPYSVAVGTAVGAGVSCTPFVGFHFLLAFAIAWALRGNLVAGAIGTGLGNPFTFPFLWAASYEIGLLVLGRVESDAPDGLAQDLAEKSWGQLWPVIEPMTVGAVPLGMAIGCIVFGLVYKAVSAYQAARRTRFAGRRAVTEAASQ
jgi:uncharacterized protein (DUF2062 family)